MASTGISESSHYHHQTGLYNSGLRNHPLTGQRLIDYLTTRNRVPYYFKDVVNLARDHPPFLYQLNLMKKLPVHDGCVNTICWNKTGEYILSGSDDRNLCITKPTNLFDNSKEYTVSLKLPTRHMGNIFSAQFVPNRGDSLLVSCSSEGPVIVHDINTENPSDGWLSFGCHSSTIYEVVTLPQDDSVFLSCSEDRTLRLYDMRCHRSCARAGTCPHPALIRNSHAMTTLSVHPINSNLLLVGRADGLGLVYDRRKLPDPRDFSREKAHAEYLANDGQMPTSSKFKNFMHPLEGVVSQFSVPDMEERCRFTSLCFSANGKQVLASYSQEYIYLFNYDNSTNFELIQTLPKREKIEDNNSDSNNSNNGDNPSEHDHHHHHHPTTNQQHRNRSRTPRIRVRGDWSDTGQNSTPRGDRSRVGNRGTNILQRLTDAALVMAGRTAPVTELILGPVRLDTHQESSDSRSNRGEHRNESSARDDQPSSDEDDEDNADDDDEDDDVADEDLDDDEHGDDDDDDDDDDCDEWSTTEDEKEEGDESVHSEARNEISNVQFYGTEHEARRRAQRADKNDSADVEMDEGSASNRTPSNDEGSTGADSNSRISSKTKAKFRKTFAGLKDRLSRIPSYKPRVRYQGHRNSRTSIKESIFWGDKYIMSGSDCGRIMVWEKDTAKLVMAFPADDRVVNCFAPNPTNYALASSGIDYDIKLWTTQNLIEHPLIIGDAEMESIVQNNELMLEEAKRTITVPPHLFFRVLASFAHNNARFGSGNNNNQ